MQELKEQLEKEAGELEVEIKDASKEPEYGTDVEGEMAEEEADEAEEEGLELGVKQVLKERMEDIENALEKIIKGSYGKCEQCGKDIPLEVLRVNPESRHCKNCNTKNK